MKLSLLVFRSPYGPQFILADENGDMIPGQIKVEVTCIEQARTKAVVTFILDEVEPRIVDVDLAALSPEDPSS